MDVLAQYDERTHRWLAWLRHDTMQANVGGGDKLGDAVQDLARMASLDAESFKIAFVDGESDYFERGSL